MNKEPSRQLRVRSVGTKLTAAEYGQCEKSAARRGQTMAEWCRRVRLKAAAGLAPALDSDVILPEPQVTSPVSL